MTLNDGTVVNAPITFLGMPYERNRVWAFDFNGHTIRTGDEEAANRLRDEIIEKIPEATTLSDARKAAQWESVPQIES